MIDNKFTKQIQDYLMQEEKTAEQIIAGATLLFRINKNKALYQRILRQPLRFEKKVAYELNKHLKYRLDGLTLNEVRILDKKVIADVDKMIDDGEPDSETNTETEEDEIDTSKKKLGKRADHDKLPPEIQSLWDINAKRWTAIKEARATIEGITMPCDRYEYLKFMNEAYIAYKTDMAKYDAYNINDTESNEANSDAEISSARAYISRYRKKYDELLSNEGSTEDINTLHEKIQQRVDLLMHHNAALSGELADWLHNNNFELIRDESGSSAETGE